MPLHALIRHTAIQHHMPTIETLTGSNYKKWKCDIELALCLVNLDVCLLEDTMVVISEDSSLATKEKLRNWEISNRFSLKIMKRSISDTTFGSAPSYDKPNEFLNATEKSLKNLTGQKLEIL